MPAAIKKITAREILDSRGNPTIECELSTASFTVSAKVPSGASTGIHEAIELRDNDKKRYSGKGVLKAVSNVNGIIAKKIIGMDCTLQEEIDNLMIELDGTDNKASLGANAILSVSMAVCKAGTISLNLPLYEYVHKISGSKKIGMPVPQMNIINSGKHIGVENDIQEHMILPVGFKNFSDALRAGTETYHELKKILTGKFGAKASLLGDEGGFSPPVYSIEERLEIIMKAIENAGYKEKIKLGIDCAASEFYSSKDNEYKIIKKRYTKEQLVDFYKDIAERYNIISIEDPMSEDDWEGWQVLNKELGRKIQIIGDDLLVTNVKRIEKATREKSCNSLLLKVNQIGTITEAIKAANLSYRNKWSVVVSHRSGETEDSFIADLAVGIGAEQVKFGAPARGERTAKYNRLLKIEEELKSR